MKFQRLEWFVLGLAVLTSIFSVLHFGVALQDDAYIGLRYSQNLAEGNGLVYNKGEKVEGYTNFLWIILGSIAYFIGVDPLLFLRVLGALSLAFATVSIMLLSRQLSDKSGFPSIFAVIVFTSLPIVFAETVMGLETILFTALILTSLNKMLEYWKTGLRGWHACLFLAAAALTRPEGYAVAFILFFFDLFFQLKKKSPLKSKSNFFRKWIGFAVIAFSHLVFRIFYYGDIVPNTFHAKVGGGMNALGRGFQYLQMVIKDTFPILLFIALLAGYLFVRKIHIAQKRNFFVLGTIFLFLTLYVAYIGGDFKPSHRFFILPLALLISMASSLFNSLLQTQKQNKKAILLISLALVVSLAGFFQGRQAIRFVQWRRSYLPVLTESALWINSEFPENSILATCNAGIIPYFAELTTVDMLGLCDRYIASRPMDDMGKGTPGHEKGDGLYVLSRHPDIILFMLSRISAHPLTEDEVAQKLFGVSEHEIWSNGLFHSDYELVSIEFTDFYFNYYQRI